MGKTVNAQAQRKNDHVVHALKQYQATSDPEFAQTRFIHHSFTATRMDQVDLSTQLGPLTLRLPFFINAITGGSYATNPINDKLALVARETGLAMATGSNSIAMKAGADYEALRFANLRSINPQGLIFANLGAHHNLENAKRAVDLLQADALQIHLNTPQELTMPEGDRDFSMWLDNIADIVNHLGLPVIVKEVGFGMSRETIACLLDCGISIIDISGKGGTNFVAIENARRQVPYSLLEDWGLSTLESLIEAQALKTYRPFNLIASGGIKNAHDMAKALALGADAIGLSGQILYLIQSKGLDATLDWVEAVKEELTVIMSLVNAPTIKDLQEKQILIAPSLQTYAHARGLNWQHFANRAIDLRSKEIGTDQVSKKPF